MFVQEMSLSLYKLSLPGSRHPPADQPNSDLVLMSTSYIIMFVTILLIIDASSAVLHPTIAHRNHCNHDIFNDIHDSFNEIHERVWSVRVGGVVFPGFPFLELGKYEAVYYSTDNCNSVGKMFHSVVRVPPLASLLCSQGVGPRISECMGEATIEAMHGGSCLLTSERLIFPIKAHCAWSHPRIKMKRKWDC